MLTLFIAYHITVLLVSNLPSEGSTGRLYRLFSRYALMEVYRQATETPQSWRFFGPNPPHVNEYMRVLVEDRSGRITDVQHDTYRRQTYPYLWYDHMRKVNRRLSREIKFQPGYAAWVCRTWERTHGGQPAAEVRFVRLFTHIPPPPAAYTSVGYDPMALPVDEIDAGRYRCAELEQGQLPPPLRRRFGLPATGDGTFKKAELSTWWDKRETRGRGSSRPSSATEPADDKRAME